MKFSYRLLKKIYPNILPIKKTAELLTEYSFETEVVDKNTLDVDVLPNRYSDAGSHLGLVREIGVIENNSEKITASFRYHSTSRNDAFLSLREARSVAEGDEAISVKIKTPKCRRMIAVQMDNIKIKQSPKWIKDFLKDIGQQPINNLVDITNYVTAETGQPLHAFDLDKMEGSLTVRSAKKDEIVISLDNKKYQLDKDDLVLADDKMALDVAGIKGGKKAEVDKNTKRILLTAGNFNGASIYKTSRKIGLVTDASLRFSRQLHPQLVDHGISRGIELIKELCNGRPKAVADEYPKKVTAGVYKFNIDKFNKITGLNLKEKTALSYLKRLGFKIKNMEITPPPLRTDINRFEDLVEEIVRLYGCQNLPAEPPSVVLKPTESEERVLFHNKIRAILTGFGFDEVYNYSIVPEKISEADAIAIENPVSKHFSRLRTSLIPLLLKNVKDNFRFFNRVVIFEIGHVFLPQEERPQLAMAIADKKQETFFELKGVLDGLLEKLGLVDYYFVEDELGRLQLESGGSVVGFVNYNKKGTTAEINLDGLMDLVKEEKTYQPLTKYPSVMRDLSLLVSSEKRFSEVMSVISASAPKYLDDIDLIDFFENEKLGAHRYSLTLRLVFQSREKTLTESEVNREMKKITKVLVDKLNAEIR